MTPSLTSKHKAYIAVLGVALLGLAVDRFVLGYGTTDPAAATAGRPPLGDAADARLSAALPSNPAPATSSSTPTAPATARPVSTGSMLSVARRIERAAQNWNLPDEHADGFSPTPGWMAAVRPAAPATAPAAMAASAEQLRARAAAMKLSAIIGSRRTPSSLIAVINDRAVRIGEEVQGFTLESIESRQAVLTRDGIRFELRLSE